MRPVKEYDKKSLEKIVRESKSFRDCGKKIGVDGKTAKSIILRYNIGSSHFKHKKAYEHMVGQKYNMLKILSIYRIEFKGKRSQIWTKCLCDCGKEKDILAASIKAKRTGSCGCDKSRYEKTRGKNSKLYKGYEGISGSFWGNIKGRANNRGRSINVDIKYVWELYEEQNRKCALTGLPIVFGIANHKTSCSTASLDRIDSTIGYVKGNVQWVHKTLNMMKNDIPQNIFINLCRKVNENCDYEAIDNEVLSQNHFIQRWTKFDSEMS